MNKLIIFDVLIVYTASLAMSASGVSESPFDTESASEQYNRVYGYFLKICDDYNLNVAFTSSADIVGAGYCSCFWIFKGNKWEKINTPCYSNLIFDKFSPTKKRILAKRKMLFANNRIKAFNDERMFGLFFDKQKTHDFLKEFTVPTIFLDNKTEMGISEACLKLKTMTSLLNNVDDFDVDIVMKDRFGAGGRQVYKYKVGEEKKMAYVLKRNKKLSYVIQPFVKFEKGFANASTDIRLIYLDGKIIQSYTRTAKGTDFRCNEHRGGILNYVSIKEIPTKVIELADKVSQKLKRSKSLYALDFIVSNNGNAYLLEGNTGPGLDWNESIKKNEVEAKKLIRLIVKELERRVVKNFKGDKTTDNYNNSLLIGESALLGDVL